MAVRKSPVCRGTPPKVYEIPSLPIANRVYIALKYDSDAVSKASIIDRQGLTIGVASNFHAAVNVSQIPPPFPQKTDLAICSQYIGTGSAEFALDTFSPLWRRRGHPLV